MSMSRINDTFHEYIHWNETTQDGRNMRKESFPGVG